MNNHWRYTYVVILIFLCCFGILNKQSLSMVSIQSERISIDYRRQGRSVPVSIGPSVHRNPLSVSSEARTHRNSTPVDADHGYHRQSVWDWSWWLPYRNLFPLKSGTTSMATTLRMWKRFREVLVILILQTRRSSLQNSHTIPIQQRLLVVPLLLVFLPFNTQP